MTTCPSNLGATLKATVRIKLPYLFHNRELLNEISQECDLQLKYVDDENFELIDVSSSRKTLG
jgi:protein-arginine kinase